MHHVILQKGSGRVDVGALEDSALPVFQGRDAMRNTASKYHEERIHIGFKDLDIVGIVATWKF